MLEAATYALDKMCLAAVAARDRPRSVRPLPDPGRVSRFHPPLVGARRAHDLRPVRPGLRRPRRRRSCWSTTPTRRRRCWRRPSSSGSGSRTAFPTAQQFNSIHERLLEVFRSCGARRAERFYFAALAGCVEDYMTVNYLRDVAMQAGFDTAYLNVEDIGWHAGGGVFTDLRREPDPPVLQALSLGMDAAGRVRPAPAAGRRAAGSSRRGRPC